MTQLDLEALCLSRDDLERVAEFFDCDVDAAFEFARKIWLPDASQTALRLMHAIRMRDWCSVLYLCDKLREGARCVGATRIMQFANEIERAVGTNRLCWLREKAEDLRVALDTLGSLLLDCIDSPSLEAPY